MKSNHNHTKMICKNNYLFHVTWNSEHLQAYEQQPSIILPQRHTKALRKIQCCFVGVIKSHTVNAAVKSPVNRTTTNYFLFNSTLSKKDLQPRSRYSRSISPWMQVLLLELFLRIPPHKPIPDEKSIGIWLPAASLGTTFKLLVSTSRTQRLDRGVKWPWTRWTLLLLLRVNLTFCIKHHSTEHPARTCGRHFKTGPRPALGRRPRRRFEGTVSEWGQKYARHQISSKLFSLDIL